MVSNGQSINNGSNIWLNPWLLMVKSSGKIVNNGSVYGSIFDMLDGQ